jgi:hypothetical protein
VEGFLSIGPIVVLEDIAHVHAFVDLGEDFEDMLRDLNVVFIDSCPLDDVEVLLFACIQLLDDLALDFDQELLELDAKVSKVGFSEIQLLKTDLFGKTLLLFEEIAIDCLVDDGLELLVGF